MGVFDRLKFWKKDELGELDKDISFNTNTDFNFNPDTMMQGDELGLGTEEPGQQDWNHRPQYPRQHQAQQQAQPQSYNQPQQRYQQYERPVIVQDEPSGGFGSKEYSIQKDIEVISAKIDALKAGIDAMNQRLATLEREIMHKRW